MVYHLLVSMALAVGLAMAAEAKPPSRQVPFDPLWIIHQPVVLLAGLDVLKKIGALSVPKACTFNLNSTVYSPVVPKL
ncbi:hypothetical protein D3C86_2057400 [compost metagenome]